MNQRKAFKETLDLAYERGMHHLHLREDLSFGHLEDMYRRLSHEEFSDSKLGRWLGWAQATVVASGVATLEEMKAINKRHAGDPPQEFQPDPNTIMWVAGWITGAPSKDVGRLNRALITLAQAHGWKSLDERHQFSDKGGNDT